MAGSATASFLPVFVVVLLFSAHRIARIPPTPTGRTGVRAPSVHPDSGRSLLHGRVRADATGRPLAGAHVRLRIVASADAPAATRLTDVAGRFRFSGLVAGNYELRVQAPGYRPAADTLVVGEGRELRAEIRLMSPGTPPAATGVTNDDAFGTRIAIGSGRVMEMDQSEIERLLPSMPSLADVLGRLGASRFEVVPVSAGPAGIDRVRTAWCLRSVGAPRCALVVLDGAPLGKLAAADRPATMSLEELCHVRLVPPAEAMREYGVLRGRFGVVDLDTRPCS